MARHLPTRLLLTLDAFGTIFTPRETVVTQYMDVARRLGFASVDEVLLQRSFRRAFKDQSQKHPNYGKVSGMKAPEWWANVIKSTFTPFISDANPLPSRLVPELLTRFSSLEGYRLYPDVSPFFETIRKSRRDSATEGDGGWLWKQTVVGVITNSDDRVPSILSSLGLTVGSRMVHKPSKAAPGAHMDEDISFVVLSYDVGAEKPDPAIFKAAKDMLRLTFEDGHTRERDETTAPQSFAELEDFAYLHVGDDVKKDVLGAHNAGFHSILLDREEKHAQKLQFSARKIISVPMSAEPEREPSTSHTVQIIRDLQDLRYWTPRE